MALKQGICEQERQTDRQTEADTQADNYARRARGYKRTDRQGENERERH